MSFKPADTIIELDEQTNAFLQAGKAAGGPQLEDMSITEARESMKQLMLAAGPPRCETVTREDLTVSGPIGTIPVAVYQPEQSDKTLLPAIIFFHGGGWSLGDIESYDNFARFFCENSNVIVVSVDYRLAPEHKFPAGLNDCYAAFEWFFKTASQWGADNENISLMGDSAGANFVAAVTHRAQSNIDIHIAHQILLYPVLSAGNANSSKSFHAFGGGDHFISQSSIKWTEDLYLDDPSQAQFPAVSPILEEDFSGLPSALIITAGFDPLRDKAQAYAEKLRLANVPVQYKCFETTIHGFLSFPGAIDTGMQGLNYVAEWISKNLHS